LRRATGWSPSISLDETLSDCLAWWRSHVAATA
jgi:nucleoside-diphosphate-sugar epimerase